MPRRHPLIGASLAGALLAALVGCAVEPGGVRGGFDLLGPAGPSLGLQVRLLQPPRLQTMPSSWTQARFILSSSTALTADRNQNVNKAGSFADSGAGTEATGSVSLFSGARAGSYTLFASLFDGTVRNAVGGTSVTLAAGTSTSATITLRTLPSWTNGVLINTNAAAAASFAGDAGAPADANVSTPRGMAFEGDGTLYLADYGNYRIRKLNSGQTTISTVGGTGNPTVLAPVSLAYDSNHDVLFIADKDNRRIRYISDPGGTPTLSATTFATNGNPLAIAYDATRDALYVAEDTHCIERIADPFGTPATTVLAGSAGSAGDSTTTTTLANLRMNSPAGLALDDTATYLYVADTGNRRVRRLAIALDSATVLAGTGADTSTGDGKSATLASLRTPTDLAYDTTDGGRLYVLDTAAYVVRAITVANGMIATVYGTSGTSAYDASAINTQATTLFAPLGLAYRSGSIYVSETGTNGHRVRKAS